MPTSFAKTQRKVKRYIEKHVALELPGPDGSTLKERLVKMKRDADNPAIPASMRAAMQQQIQEGVEPDVNTYEHWLLSRFWELDTGRSQGPNGPDAISFSDIAAYAEAFGEDLEPIEVQMLKSIDVSYLDAVFSEQRKHREGQA